MDSDDLFSGLMDAAYRLALRVAREKVAAAGWYEFEEVLAQAADSRLSPQTLSDARALGVSLYGRAVGEPQGTPPPPV